MRRIHFGTRDSQHGRWPVTHRTTEDAQASIQTSGWRASIEYENVFHAHLRGSRKRGRRLHR